MDHVIGQIDGAQDGGVYVPSGTRTAQAVAADRRPRSPIKAARVTEAISQGELDARRVMAAALNRICEQDNDPYRIQP